MRTYLIITLSVILTALWVKYAYIDRGYWAVGGEWLPMLLLIGLALKKTLTNETAIS